MSLLVIFAIILLLYYCKSINWYGTLVSDQKRRNFSNFNQKL